MRKNMTRRDSRRIASKIALGAVCLTLSFAGAACQSDGGKETTAVQTKEETAATSEDETNKATEAETTTEDAKAEETADGWHTDEKGKYFLIDGKRQTGMVDLTAYMEIEEGLQYANAYIYAFDEDGYLMQGWIEKDGKKYYATEEGWLYVSYAEIDGVHYVFNGAGELSTGLKLLLEGTEEKLFYYEETGRVESDWRTVGKETVKTFYFDENGEAVTGWQTIDGKKYYFGVEDETDMLAAYRMATGEVTIDGEAYEFGEDGVLAE